MDEFLKAIGRRELSALDELHICGGMRAMHAFCTRMGMKVPTEKVREVTDEDHERIRLARASVSEEQWLLPSGIRDALAIELNITPEQIAAVLAVQTKRDTAPLPARAADPPAAEPKGARSSGRRARTPQPTGKSTITLDPSTWPEARAAKGSSNGSGINLPPTKKEYQVDAEDRTLVIAVVEACRFTASRSVSDPWPQMLNKICVHRRLTQQQVRGLVARNAPEHSSTAVGQA